MAQLVGKNVLITGALGSIGRALVARYAEEGANVIALDLATLPDAQKTLDGIAKDIRFVGCDLGNLAELETTATALADEVGGIDVLVNNAALVIFKQHDEFTLQEYEDQVRVNSTAVFVLSRICAKHMKAKKVRGVVVELETADKLTDNQLVAKVKQHFATSSAKKTVTLKKTAKKTAKATAGKRTKKSGK